jgi:hypothetical protein
LDPVKINLSKDDKFFSTIAIGLATLFYSVPVVKLGTVGRFASL